jgi:FxLD family lantipeptide
MEPSDFSLDVRLVASGPAVAGTATEDCTSDNCGDTPGSAGIANC